MDTYADRLKRAMKARGIDQSTLARQVGVKQQSIQYLCRKGTQSVHSVKIAEILEISPSWLTDGAGDMDMSNESIFIDRYKRLSHDQKKMFELILDQINAGTQKTPEKVEKTLDNKAVIVPGGGGGGGEKKKGGGGGGGGTAEPFIMSIVVGNLGQK